MRLFLARHGETDWNLLSRIQGQTDTQLNATGKNQAKDLADKLLKQNYQIDSIYTSKHRRAMETAEIVGTALGIKPTALDGLEEMSFGKWEGNSWNHVIENFNDEYKIWHQNRRYTRTPDGESYQQVLDRLLPALRTIKEKETGNVLVLTHSAVIMALLSYINDTPFEDMVKNYRTANADIIELGIEEI